MYKVMYTDKVTSCSALSQHGQCRLQLLGFRFVNIRAATSEAALQDLPSNRHQQVAGPRCGYEQR